MKKLIALIFALTLLLAFYFLSCSNRLGPESESNRPGEIGILRDNPIASRQNPLQNYIRSNWTYEDETSTAGCHYDHIKVYGGPSVFLDDEEAEFAADHFDIFRAGGPEIEQYVEGTSVIWLAWALGAPYINSNYDYEQVHVWIDSLDNEGDYTWEDLVMHLKFDDVVAEFGWIPGWNPDDDQDEDGCIDGEIHTDPERTADCIWDAELRKIGGNNLPWWKAVMKPDSWAGVLDMHSDRCAWFYEDHCVRGAFVDHGALNVAGIDYGFQNTFAYGGEHPSSEYSAANAQYYEDKIHYLSHFTYELEQKLGGNTIVVTNTVSPIYTCKTTSLNCAKQWLLEYVENVFDECWLQTNLGTQPALTKAKREYWLDCPFLDYLEAGKGYIFGVLDGENGFDDRANRFSLATFYMINHQMGFYYYRRDHDSAEDISRWGWNPYVEFEVGQPVENSFDLEDFQGNDDTDRFFVWEDHPSYEILGREYLRDDDKRVLVLTKIMALGLTEGDSTKSHCLPGFYSMVLFNDESLYLSDPTDAIDLAFNDGAVLVEVPLTFTDIQWTENALNCQLTISWNTPDIECQGRAYLYTGTDCGNFVDVGIDGQLSESHSVTFDVSPGLYYSVELFARKDCSSWLAENDCRYHRMGRCTQ